MSRYQWIVDDPSASAFTAHFVFDLDADDETELGATRMQRQQQQQQQQLLRLEGGSLASDDAQSEARNSRRSHRSAGSRPPQPQPQRKTSSGGGSKHSSSSGGGSRGQARMQRPAWMTTTSVYGAEKLDDSEEERETGSPTSAKRKAATTLARGRNAKRTPASSQPSSPTRHSRGGGNGSSTYLVFPADEIIIETDSDGSAEIYLEYEAEEDNEGEEFEFEPDHSDTFEYDAQHGLRMPAASSSNGTGGHHHIGMPPINHDDGRTSPVTATFYYTPNTNAEARASANEAMRNGGLLYPADSSTIDMVPAERETAGGLAYNKKLHKKNMRKQQQRAGGGLGLTGAARTKKEEEEEDNSDLSFAATVEALARRARSKAHLMPDYDSDHEARQRAGLGPADGSVSPVTGSTPVSSLEVSPYERQGRNGDGNKNGFGGCSDVGDDYEWFDDDDGRFASQGRQRQLGRHASGNDFDRYQRHQPKPSAAAKGAPIGAPFPAPAAPLNMQEIYDASGFFISPMHQSVAEATSPWPAMNATDNNDAAGVAATPAAPHIFFMGQGGLTGAAQHCASLFPPTASVPVAVTATATTSAADTRRTISSGSSILRVPAGVLLPPQVTGTATAAVGKRRRGAGPHHTDPFLAPLSDRELEKAAEEALFDNLSAVISAGAAAGGSRKRRKPCRFSPGDINPFERSGGFGLGASNGCSAATTDDDDGGGDFFSSVMRNRSSARAGGGGGLRRGFGGDDDDSPTNTAHSLFPSSTFNPDGCLGGSDIDHDDDDDDSFSSDSCDAHSGGGGGGEEAHVLKRLKRRRNQRRRLERVSNECGGSLVLAPSASPSMLPPADYLPSSKADMREDLLESFFIDARLHDDDTFTL